MGRPGLDKHPKFRRLMHVLKETRAHIRGHLECLWEVAYENGNPEIGDAMDVALAADWQGEPGAFCKAALECGGKGKAGFIEPTSDNATRYRIHDLYDHAPEYVRKRCDRETDRQRRGTTLQKIRSTAARTAALARWQKDASRIGDDASRMPCGTTPAPAPAPAPSTLSCACAQEPPIVPQGTKPRRRCNRYTEEFETFWSVVVKTAPHKAKSKAEAAKRYAEAVDILHKRGTDDPHGFLQRTAAAYYASPEGQTQFANGPAPWLNKGRYDDSPEAWQRSGDESTGQHEPVDEPIPER